MIAEANRDIRWAMREADKERRERLRTNLPFAYLDEVIVSLETLHLAGLTVVPRTFMPRLHAVNELLPPGIEAPSQWRRRIARAIDQCFDLQESVLLARKSQPRGGGSKCPQPERQADGNLDLHVYTALDDDRARQRLRPGRDFGKPHSMGGVQPPLGGY